MIVRLKLAYQPAADADGYHVLINDCDPGDLARPRDGLDRGGISSALRRCRPVWRGIPRKGRIGPGAASAAHLRLKGAS